MCACSQVFLRTEGRSWHQVSLFVSSSPYLFEIVSHWSWSSPDSPRLANPGNLPFPALSSQFQHYRHMLLLAAVWILALWTRALHTYTVSTHRPICHTPNSPVFKINYTHFRRKSLSYRETLWVHRMVCVLTLFRSCLVFTVKKHLRKTGACLL